MKYLIIIYASIVLFGCGDKSIIESHQTMHESDIVPFTYEANVRSGVVSLKITPEEEGIVLYPFQFYPSDEITEDGRVTIGNLVLSTTKENSNISYWRVSDNNRISTLIKTDLFEHEQVGANDNREISVTLCEKCLELGEDRLKQHVMGHVIGRHYHLKIPN